MKMLIYFEKKKILRRRSTMIACMLMLLCIGTISLEIISDQHYFGEDGTELSGVEAIRAERNLVQAQAGPLTQERLKNTLHQYQTVYGDPENYDSTTGSLQDDIYLKSILPYRGLLNLIREACVPAGTPEVYDMSVLSAGVTDETVDHFYEMRNVRIQEMLDMDYTAGNFTPTEKETFRKMNQQVSEPFSYDYSGGWKGLLVRSFPMAFLLIGLAVCIIISPIFAYEYQTGTDAVILSAKYGRRETVRAKIAAGFLVTSGIYAMAVLCDFVSIFAFFGIKGWNCDFQIMFLKTFYSLKIWQVALIGIIINYIVVMSIMAFTMLMSAVCKTPFAAVIISTLCTIAPMFISESKISRGINHIISLFPAKAMDTYSVFSKYILFTFGRVVLTLPYMILITAVVVIVFTLSIAYRRFCRHQVA